ncbi:hypothetical protein B0H19DRAFT_1073195 [Mycena capillaripes]|nr:hypothetical protein B0H19DRAFT_1073195 [Mycena capillaripes]
MPGSNGFFSGASNFTISGGTFNEIAGDLNQHTVYHYSAQYNQVTGNLNRYNSPTTVNFGCPPPQPSRSITDPPPSRRGAGRGNYYPGTRMGPYNNITRGPEPLAQIPPFRSTRGRGVLSSPEGRSPSMPNSSRGPGIYSAPSPSRGPGMYPGGLHYPQQSGSGNGFANGRRRGNPWAYTPPVPSPVSPTSYRGPHPTEDEDMSDVESLKSEDKGQGSDTESDGDTPCSGNTAPERPSTSRAAQRTRSV